MNGSRPALAVESTGFLTTVQDLGRYGAADQGIPECGGMDRYAMQCANLLAAAPRTAAALEITLIGPVLVALASCVIAIAGGDLGAEIDGEPLPAWHSARLRPGQRIAFRRPRNSAGARAYLAVDGGVDVPLVLGSRSTCLAAGFGGLSGRPLQSGDILNAFPALMDHPDRTLTEELIPRHAPMPTVRVIPGPERSAFTVATRRAFYAAPHTVSQSSNRTGYRLTGRPLAFRSGRSADILTEGVLFGTVQVTADGLPLLLMADHPTTGGYARIATVISADLPVVAQLAPGDQLKFAPVEPGQAEQLARNQEQTLRLLDSVLLWNCRKP